MRRHLLSRLSTIPVVALRHAPKCKHAGRRRASECDCRQVLEPVRDLETFLDEEDRCEREHGLAFN